MSNQNQMKQAQLFKSLHDQKQPFILPNAWDAGSAKILAHMGFKACATTSAGLAYTMAKEDAEGIVTIDEMLDNASEIKSASGLPVSADLENGGGLEPAMVAETITRAINRGLVGCTIEDTTYNPSAPIIEFSLAVERVKAAVAAKNQSDIPFMLTARSENFSCGIDDIGDTLCRLKAFEEAGADVLYAPGVKNLKDIELLCRELNNPVNAVVGYKGVNFTAQELANVGVRRISLGSSLARAAWQGYVHAVSEVVEKGSFNFAQDILSFAEMAKFMKP